MFSCLQPFNMKFTVTCLFLLGSVLAVVSSKSPSGYRPQGALLLLPPEFSPGFSQSQKDENLEEVSQKIMERLRQEQGSSSGVYHVFHPDGKLQKVQYTSAPLRTEPNYQQNNYNQRYTQNYGSQNFKNFGSYGSPNEQFTKDQGETFGQYSITKLNPVVAHFGRYQYDSVQQQQQRSQRQYQQQQSNNYIASVKYTDVDPIRPPVYSYSSSPLTRVLRYAPEY